MAVTDEDKNICQDMTYGYGIPFIMHFIKVIIYWLKGTWHMDLLHL